MTPAWPSRLLRMPIRQSSPTRNRGLRNYTASTPNGRGLHRSTSVSGWSSAVGIGGGQPFEPLGRLYQVYQADCASVWLRLGGCGISNATIQRLKPTRPTSSGQQLDRRPFSRREHLRLVVKRADYSFEAANLRHEHEWRV